MFSYIFQKSVTQTIKCLLALPAKKLADHLWDHYDTLYFMEFPLTVVSKDRNFFWDKDVYHALWTGDFKSCDVIVGINADEGSFWMTYNFPTEFG